MTNQTVFKRYELKYIIDWKMYNSLRNQIEPFTNSDSYSREQGGYSILSLYYDTINYNCYYAKIDGEKLRQKLRIRWYLSDDESYTSAHIELKKKYVDQVLKRRLKIDKKSIDKFLEGIISPDKICKDEKELSIAKEILYYYELMKLKPKVYVHYFREAYYSKFENRLRITFDKKISCSSWHREEFMREGNRYIINPFYMVMEIKFFNSMPLWLINILNHYNLLARRISKYCIAVETANLLKLNLKEGM